MRAGLVSVLAFAVAACGSQPTVPAVPVVAVDVQAGGTGSSGYPGQSFTLPAGMRINKLRVNFYQQGNVRAASGTLYLLTQAYANLPERLSPATFGYLSHTSNVEGNQFVFPEEITISGEQRHWIYTVTQQSYTFYFQTNPYSGGTMFSASHGSQPFIERTDQDIAFRIEGTTVAK